MNILVTGSCGQLGTEMRSAAAGSPHRFIFTDVKGENVEYLDIADAEAVNRFVREREVGIIVNCAAYTDVDRAEDDPDGAFAVNCAAVGNLASAAAACGATLIHISTDYVFDGNASTPYKETDLPDPQNAYGRSKLAGERLIEGSGCKYLIFRTSWLYSPCGKNFVRTMLRLLREKDEVRVVSDQRGSPTYAADLAALICKIIDGGMYDRIGIYHFSNTGDCTWYDFALEINELYQNLMLTTAEERRQEKEDTEEGKENLKKVEEKEEGTERGNEEMEERKGEETKMVDCGRGDGGSLCRIKPCSTEEYPSKARRPAWSVLDKTKVTETFGTEIPHWKDSLKTCLARML